MPHYFFCFRDGGALEDHMGMDLSDEDSARDGIEDVKGKRLFDVRFKDVVEIS